jgi:hypothetical protein
MHITLQLAIQIATLVSVILGFLGLMNAVNSYRRQMNVQILMKYTERYEHILEQLPEDAFTGRFDASVLPAESPQLTRCVLKYLNLCAEEYYLTCHHYLSGSLWKIWEGDLKRVLRSPLLEREWRRLRTEFVSNREFLAYVERVQAEPTASRANSQ